MSKPHVVQVLWSLGRAGAERVVFELARALPDHGFDVTVIAAGGGGDMEGDFHDAGIPLVIGPAVSSFKRWQTVQFLKRQFQELKPDIIHAHLSEIWTGYAARNVERGTPFIITAHNDDRDDPWIRHVLRGMAFRKADHVACISKVVERYVFREFKVNPAKASVVRNGIDVSRAIPRPKKAFSSTPRLITVGRLVRQKDHRTLFEALRLVKDIPWELEVVGDGPLRDRLERLSVVEGLGERVHFVGTVDDVPERLSRADLFCFPSRWEGQGLAPLEAAAAGVPILASDLPVFHETFDHRSMAFAAPGRADEWARALREILDDPTGALARAAVAKGIVESQFALDRMVRQYAGLYEKLLAVSL